MNICDVEKGPVVICVTYQVEFNALSNNMVYFFRVKKVFVFVYSDVLLFFRLHCCKL